MNRVLTVLLGVAMLCGLTTVQAQADVSIAVTREGCTANHHHAVPGYNLRVYMGYSSADNGTNCAWVEKTSGTSVRTPLGIGMAKCVSAAYNGRYSCPITGTWSFAHDNYFLYAGPVWQRGTNGKCIWIEVAYQGRNWWTPFAIHHCG